MSKRLFSIIIILLSINVSFGNGISKIQFIFDTENSTTTIPICCSLESFIANAGPFLQMEITTDTSFINKFTNYLNLLESDSVYTFIDARIMAILFYEDVIETDTVCFGEYGGISYNGTIMKTNNEFLSLVKEKVWPEQPLDSLMIKLPYYKNWTHEEILMFINLGDSIE